MEISKTKKMIFVFAILIIVFVIAKMVMMKNQKAIDILSDVEKTTQNIEDTEIIFINCEDENNTEKKEVFPPSPVIISSMIEPTESKDGNVENQKNKEIENSKKQGSENEFQNPTWDGNQENYFVYPVLEKTDETKNENNIFSYPVLEREVDETKNKEDNSSYIEL